jgi:hypothetical protein
VTNASTIDTRSDWQYAIGRGFRCRAIQPTSFHKALGRWPNWHLNQTPVRILSKPTCLVAKPDLLRSIKQAHGMRSAVPPLAERIYPRTSRKLGGCRGMQQEAFFTRGRFRRSSAARLVFRALRQLCRSDSSSHQIRIPSRWQAVIPTVSSEGKLHT